MRTAQTNDLVPARQLHCVNPQSSSVTARHFNYATYYIQAPYSCQALYATFCIKMRSATLHIVFVGHYALPCMRFVRTQRA